MPGIVVVLVFWCCLSVVCWFVCQKGFAPVWFQSLCRLYRIAVVSFAQNEHTVWSIHRQDWSERTEKTPEIAKVRSALTMTEGRQSEALLTLQSAIAEQKQLRTQKDSLKAQLALGEYESVPSATASVVSSHK